jgi:hypothetical protein
VLDIGPFGMTGHDDFPNAITKKARFYPGEGFPSGRQQAAAQMTK